VVMVIPEVRRFLLGCDLAKSLDYTSFAVIEMVYETKIKGFAYHLRALDRIKGVDYLKITDLVIASIQRLQNEQGTTDGPHICMDASGLGAPISGLSAADRYSTPLCGGTFHAPLLAT
jgi:hypothetical protein